MPCRIALAVVAAIGTVHGITPVQAQNERWTYVTEGANGTAWYISTEDMWRGGPDQTLATMWVKWDHSKDGSTKFRRTIIRYTVSCPERRYRWDTATSYDPAGKATTIPGDGQFEYVVPDTALEEVIDLLCA